jgi:D-alanyl-D-alanine carboxypeptidase
VEIVDSDPPPSAQIVDPNLSRLAALADRLARYPGMIQYGPNGDLAQVSGLPLADARETLFPVSRTRPLPDGFVPPDLVNDFHHYLRALIADDLRAMFQAAERDGAYPQVVSGYRSADYQALVFERAVQRQLAQNESLSRADAEDRAARFVAPPGRSQHQLGTTADLSSSEISYGIRAIFAETNAGRWLAEHAWEYGFVMPYTAAAEPRTGYVPEPWHYRWVGRPLAAFLRQQQYLESAYPTADDWLLTLESLLQDRSSWLP